MAFLRYANARAVSPYTTGQGWDNVRVAAAQTRMDRNLVDQASKILNEQFDPSRYLLSHATIVASVDTVDVPNARLGAATVGGKLVNRKTTAFRIKPECEQYINNNCFVPGTLITLADGSVKPIEEVIPGDEVLTHLGRGRKVTRTISRDVSEDLVEVKVRGSNETLLLTKDHPLFVFRPNDACVSCGGPIHRTHRAIQNLLGKFYCTKECYYHHKVPNADLLKQKSGRFVEAGVVTDRDFATLPVIAGTSPVPLTLGQARLVGLFAAEGYYELDSRNGNERVGCCWAFHARETDTLAKTVVALMRSEFGVECAIRPHGDHGIVVTTRTNRDAVGFFSRWVRGENAREKSLHGDLLTAPLDLQLEVVRGWLDGDGSAVDTRTCGSAVDNHPGDFRVMGSSASRSLAYQMRAMLHRLGVAPRMSYWATKDPRPGWGWGNGVTEQKTFHSWTLSCGAGYVEELVKTTRFEEPYDKAMADRGGGVQEVPTLRFLNGYCLQMIEAVRRKPYAGPVYNFEVDEDHSYLANGVATHNCDSWSRPVLLKSYRTFVGAHNFLEHVQIENLSKGRILDAVARDIGDSVYIDILIATDRKHRELIKDIESGELTTLSMGCSIDGSTCTKCGHWAADETEFCFPPGTRVLKSDGKYVAIEEIVSGDVVLTHKGNHRRVLNTMSRHYDGHVSVLTVDGVPNPVRATVNHPFWVLRPRQDCACGCGQLLRHTVEHERGASQSFQRRFLPGHNSRVWNHNKSENILTLEDYTRLFDLDMEFVPAKELRKGDYLTFPIPQEVHNTEDATERRARLIGYFLSEGSYIKRDGERVGVEFTFGHHETNTLAAEVLDLLNAEWGQATRLGTGAGWKEISAKSGVKPIRRRVNSRPVPSDVSCPDCGAPSEYAGNASFNPKRDDCYACKVCGMQWLQNADRSVQARLYPPSVEGQGSCSVRLMIKETADWFYRYCGEYSDGKQLHPDVMRWEPEVQKHILFGWMNGDGTQSHTGITGCTASFHLMSQMHVLAARCGWYGRKQVVFGDRVTEVNQVVNGDGSVTARDHRGWLPQFRMVLSEPSGFGQEVKFTEPEKARVTLSSFTDGFKRVGNWLLYRVRDTSVECYSGTVHNFEVEEDNSYVVEGLAVHNCDHIKYMKGDTFYDERGNRCRIAELCGDESLDPTAGVVFIEGSWVKVPAFRGAVARNLITLSADDNAKLAKKINRVYSFPATVPADGAFLKAAHKVLGDTPRFRGTCNPASMRVIAADDMDMGDEGGGEEAPAPPPPPADPLKDITDEIKRRVLDNVRDSLKDELTKGDLAKKLLPDSTAPNDTVVKQARMKRAQYLSQVNKIVRSAGSDLELIQKIARLNTNCSIFLPGTLYHTALRVGGSHKYGSLQTFLGKCQGHLGRAPTVPEARALVRLAKLLSTRRVGVTPKKS